MYRCTIDPVARGLPVALACAAAMPGGGQAQGLSPTERRIVEYIDAHREETIALLERVVNINSGTMNLEGVAAVGDVFRAELDALGFATRWIPMHEVQRAGHLFAERQGVRGKRLLLIGHLDTVFERDSPFQRFERDGMSAAGPGVEDMKGGDVVVIAALQALHAAGALDGAGIIVAFTGDEEETGDPLDVSRRDLLEAAGRSDVALGFEGGVGGYGTATIARRGFTGWTLRVHATPAHSSLIFRDDIGSGAIFAAARVLQRFHDELAGERYLTLNPGVMLGGTNVTFDERLARGTAFGKSNVIADSALVTGDLRTLSAEQRERAKERMRAIVADVGPHASAEIAFEESYPPMAPTEANRALLAQLDAVSRDLGFGEVTAVDPGLRGAADVSFVSSLVEASLDGLGVVGDASHTEGETVQLESLFVMAKRAAVLIHRLTADATP